MSTRAAVLGESRLVPCVRVVPLSTSRDIAPALAIVMAIELSRRHPPRAGEWAAQMWSAVASRLVGAVQIRPGTAGSILAAWPVENSDSLASAAELAVELLERFTPASAESAELRGGLAVGVIGGAARSEAVERLAERLALAAAPGQWLITEEVARRLEDGFELRPAGVVPRWPMQVPPGHRALIARLVAPVLPSAVRGDPPELVLGRDSERKRLLTELATAIAGRRRVVLVTAPAGGGKSHLLRRVLADVEMKVAAGVAFPPLGSRPLDPLRALLAGLGVAVDRDSEDQIGDRLALAASRRARVEPSAIVVDDVHWASREEVASLARAIAGSEHAVPLAWVLSARTAALPALSSLVDLADLRVELPALEPVDRARLVARRLGDLPDTLGAHIALGAERGNPLYLEHLSEAVREGCPNGTLPRTLHEAVLSRLEGMVERARRLAHWSLPVSAREEVEALEREVGDWLDRLETSDIADRATIGRYLARLRAVDVDLVVARSVLRMPVAANRRLGWAVERLAAASTDGLLDYLETVARDGAGTRAASEARAAAERAQRTLRLGDAERLLAFASKCDETPALARHRGDLALALGRPEDALETYCAAASGRDDDGELQRRTARAEALLGRVHEATTRLALLLQRSDVEPIVASRAGLDLARLHGLPPSATGNVAGAARGFARAIAWARPGEPKAAREAVNGLVLVGEPVACAAELIETAALSHFAGLTVDGLDAAAADAVQILNNPHAKILLNTGDVAEARRTFLHWDV